MSTYINEMVAKADKEAKDLEKTSYMLVSTGLKSYWVFESYAGVAGTSAIRYNVDDRLATFLINILMKSDYDLDLWLAKNMTEGHNRTPSADYNIKLLVPESPAYSMTFTITNNRYFAIKELLSYKEDSPEYFKILANAQSFLEEKRKHYKTNTDPREGVQYARVETEQTDIAIHHEKNEHGVETITVVGTTDRVKYYLEYLIELGYSGLISLRFPETINEPCDNTDSDNAAVHCACAHSDTGKNMRCIVPGAFDSITQDDINKLREDNKIYSCNVDEYIRFVRGMTNNIIDMESERVIDFRIYGLAYDICVDLGVNIQSDLYRKIVNTLIKSDKIPAFSRGYIIYPITNIIIIPYTDDTAETIDIPCGLVHVKDVNPCSMKGIIKSHLDEYNVPVKTARKKKKGRK